jgi:hypothetical protein
MDRARALVKLLLDADEPEEPNQSLPGESPKDFMRRNKIRARSAAPVPEPYKPYVNRAARNPAEWDEWGDLEEWQRVAVTALAMDWESLSLDYHNTDSMRVETRDGTTFLIYQDDDVAEAVAVSQVNDLLEEDPGNFNQDWLQNFIDLDSLRRQLIDDVETMYQEEFDNLDVEEMRDKLRDLGELHEEDFYDEDDEPLPLTPDLEQQITDGVADYVTRLAKDRVSDPIEYLEEIFGREAAVKEAMRIGGIDYDAAAQDAVSTDGIAHFLAGYDGDQIDLPGGAVAYRN